MSHRKDRYHGTTLIPNFLQVAALFLLLALVSFIASKHAQKRFLIN